MAIDPFASDNIHSRRPRNQCPGIAGLKNIKIRLHSSTPIRITENRPKGCWEWRKNLRAEVEAIHWLNKAVFPTGVHAVRDGDWRDRACGAVATVRPTGRRAPLAMTYGTGAAVQEEGPTTLLAATWDETSSGAAVPGPLGDSRGHPAQHV